MLCLLPQKFFADWKPIPKLCHQTRLAKLSQWLIIYWRRKTTLGNGNRRQKARDEVWDSFQQLYLFGVKVSMWPNVINLVVIHTLFVYAAVREQAMGVSRKCDCKIENREAKKDEFWRDEAIMTYWWMPACSCSAYLCCPFGRNAKRVSTTLKKTNSLWLNLQSGECINFNQERRAQTGPFWEKWNDQQQAAVPTTPSESEF